MKKIFITFFLLFSFFAEAQIVAPRHFDTGIKTLRGNDIVCPGMEGEEFLMIPPPEEIRRARQARINNEPRRSQFIVTYNGFSEKAKESFQRAVEIWEHLIYSPVPIRVTANWVEMPNNVLGSANTSRWVMEFGAAKYINTYYPIALAEKLAGKPLNSDEEDDIYCSFNKNINWHYDEADQITSSKFDLTTVVLHELGHGLGFFSTMYVEDELGTYGDGRSVFKTIFDVYVENKNGVQLVDTSKYNNNSISLYRELVSDDLHFESLGKDGKPRLYAPDPYLPGSSISHLDQNTYFSQKENLLMTPAIRSNTIVHHPGPVALGMMFKMGWKGTSIFHEGIKNVAYQPDVPVTFKVAIHSDTTLVDGSAKVIYQTRHGVDSAQLVRVDGTDKFYAEVQFPKSVDEVVYQFVVQDHFGDTIYFPGSDGVQDTQYVYGFDIGEDKFGPVMAHFPFEIVDEGFSFRPLVIADDSFDGELNVKVKYKVNNGTFETIDLVKYEPEKHGVEFSQGQNDEFSYILEQAIDGFRNGDVITYYFEGYDAVGNQSILPVEYPADGKTGAPIAAHYQTVVTSLLDLKKSYTTDFESGASDFSLLGFEIKNVQGFESNGLHSEHPYPNGLGMLIPGTDSPILDFERNAIAMLRVPVILGEGTRSIHFDEVVLVEPGEPGSRLGSPDLFDYVIVEGLLLDGSGIDWIPLDNAYDSRNNAGWEKLFNSATTGGKYPSSSAEGSSVYIKRRTINLSAGGLSDFNGAPMLIRFRLFSDQLVNGWGWSIDNLYIQEDPPVVLANEVENEMGLKIYPNPAVESVELKTTLSEPQKVTIEVFSVTGEKVIDRIVDASDREFKYNLNMKALTGGVYIVKLKEKEGVLFNRLIKL